MKLVPSLTLIIATPKHQASACGVWDCGPPDCDRFYVYIQRFLQALGVFAARTQAHTHTPMTLTYTYFTNSQNCEAGSVNSSCVSARHSIREKQMTLLAGNTEQRHDRMTFHDYERDCTIMRSMSLGT